MKKGFTALGENPYRARSGADIKKLSGFTNPTLYRLRVGDWRAVYAIANNEVKITRIFPRKKEYGWLE